MGDLVLLTRAYNFAAIRHAGQQRKGARGDPYINHLAEVAELVARATGGGDVNLIAAAVLHDAIEDTVGKGETPESLFELIMREFGSDIAGLVQEATDDKSLPKTDRKRLQVETAPHKSDRAKILKMADKTSNLRSIASSPPDWPDERQLDYVQWAREVAEGLRGVNDWIDKKFDEAARQADEALGN